MYVFSVIRVLPIPKTILRLNWKSAGLVHSPIRLSHMSSRNWKRLSPALIMFKTLRGAQSPTPFNHFPLSPVMQGFFKSHRGLHLDGKIETHLLRMSYLTPSFSSLANFIGMSLLTLQEASDSKYI